MPIQSKATDVLGLAPYGEAVKSAVDKTLDTAQTFLYDLCRPAAAELGLLFRDKVRLWRAQNLTKIAIKAQEYISISSEGVQLKAPARMLHDVIEHGSWCEDEQLQHMWAGLLAGSCDENGKDESNLLFSDILKRLSSAEAKLIEYACKNATKRIGDKGFLVALPYGVPMEDVLIVAGWGDAPTAQFHFEHLFTLGLLRGGGGVRQEFIQNYGTANQRQIPLITPEQLGLHFYVRCCGSRKSPAEFFGITERV